MYAVVAPCNRPLLESRERNSSSLPSLLALVSCFSVTTNVFSCLISRPRFLGYTGPAVMASNRAAQVSGHLSGSAPGGLLKDQVAIITGAAQGIGRSTALLFAAEGAKVVVSDLDEGKAQKVVEEIKAAGGQAIAVGGDVTAEDFPKKLIGATVEAFGDIHHIVVRG